MGPLSKSKKIRPLTRSIFNASLKLERKIVVRNTVKFNFSFLTEEKLKTKTKRYLAPAYPKVSAFVIALNIAWRYHQLEKSYPEFRINLKIKMKKITLTIITTLFLVQAYCQTDNNGNPVFNSISTTEKSVGELLLISNYYTLKNNIENKKSSVYISENPTLNQIENAAINLSSDFYILTKESKMVVMVMFQNDPKREFLTIVMATNKQKVFPCVLDGDISENRANEIISEKYDSNAVIADGVLKFNGKELKIISNREIEDAVWDLIKEEKLDKKKPSEIILPSKKEMKDYIISQTKEGGELDFFTEIKGHEYDGVQIKKGVFSTKKSVALYKWGRACFDIGVNTIEDTYEIYSEFIQKETNKQDKEYIKMGFYKEWEQ